MTRTPDSRRRTHPYLASGWGLLLFAGVLWALGAGAAPPAPAGTPVLVELFTSEGCSSCPAADRLLARLAAEQPVPGALVVPLELHVDYWNRLGWADPFSSAEFTARQQEFAAHFGGGERVYTPQMVVDGREAFVGSDERAARRAIEAAARETRASVSLATGSGAGTVRVTVVGAGGSPANVLLAVTEEGLASDVTRGENAGRRLAHTSVARLLRVVGTVDAAGRFDREERLSLPSRDAGRRHAFAFVQERGSGRVFGVSRPLQLPPG